MGKKLDLNSQLESGYVEASKPSIRRRYGARKKPKQRKCRAPLCGLGFGGPGASVASFSEQNTTRTVHGDWDIFFIFYFFYLTQFDVPPLHNNKIKKIINALVSTINK